MMSNKETSILDLLSNSRVVTISLDKDKKAITFSENCDYCFSESFAKKDMLKLLEEMKQLVDQMEG